MKDSMDTLLAFEKMASRKNNTLPEQVWDYPETVQQVLIKFIELWKLPDRSIPSKKFKGQFARWIGELDTISNLMGNNYSTILKNSFERYKEGNPFIVASPMGIHKLIVSTMAEMAREEDRLKNVNTETNRTSSDNAVDKTELEDFIKKMKANNNYGE